MEGVAVQLLKTCIVGAQGDCITVPENLAKGLISAGLAIRTEEKTIAPHQFREKKVTYNKESR